MSETKKPQTVAEELSAMNEQLKTLFNSVQEIKDMLHGDGKTGLAHSPVRPAAHTPHIITPYQLCPAMSPTRRPRVGTACPPPAQQMGWVPSPKLGPSGSPAPRD